MHGSDGLTAAEQPRPGAGAQVPRVLIAALVAGLCVRLALIWSGWASRCIICDDAYFYFEIARNTALGMGSTFDGLHPTNGYHPLFMWLLVPVFKAFPHDPWTPVLAGLSLCAVLDLCTATLIWAILSRLGMSLAAVFCAAGWMLYPGVFLLTLRGCEAPLATALVAFLVWLHLKPRGGAGRWVVSGVVSGLAFLARTDLGLFLAIFHLYHLWRAGSDEAAGGRARWGRALAGLAMAALAGLLVAAPWAMWNWHTFGSLLQTSGWMKRILWNTHCALPRLSPDTNMLAWLLGNPYRMLHNVVAYTVGEEFAVARPVTHGVTALYVVLAVAAAAVWVRALRGPRARPYREALAALGWALLWLPAYVAVYAYYLRYYWHWYFPVPLLAGVLLAGCALDYVLRSGRSRRAAAMGVAAGLVLASVLHFVQFFSRVPPGTIDAEDRRLPMYALVERLAGPKTVVGAWNSSGAFGYFGSFHSTATWVDLDGVVNHDAYQAVRRGEYAQWLTANVDVIVEDCRGTPHTATTLLTPDELRSMGRDYACLSLAPFVLVKRSLVPKGADRK